MKPAFDPLYWIYVSSPKNGEPGVCIKKDTPDDALKALEEYDKEYFDFYGHHIILFE